MSVSDIDLMKAWKQVLTLSKLQAGQTVTVLTSADTHPQTCLLYTSPSPRDRQKSRMPSSA